MSDFSVLKHSTTTSGSPGLPPAAGSSGEHAVDFSILLWILLPAWLLTWFIINPPHGVDVDIARLIASAGLAEAIDSRLGAGSRPLLHVVSKWTSIGLSSAALAALIVTMIRSRRNPEFADRAKDAVKRLTYFLIAVAVCVAVVAFLKQTTGVACPRNTIPFGGTEPITSPVFGFALRPGQCWPGGAAGSGFCLFALFFALRGPWPRLARAALVLALALGSISGFERMTSGLHFISHNIVSLLIDWLVCAVLYIAFFARGAWLAKLREELTIGAKPGSAIAFMTFWWVAVFNGPTLWHAASINGEAFTQTGSARLFFACTALFAAGSAAILTLVSLLPRKPAKTVMLVLHAAGAVSFAAAVLYGALMTPDMIRNALATDGHESAGYLGARTLFVFFWSFLPPAAVTILMTGADKKTALLARTLKERLLLGLGAGLKARLRPALACVVLLVAVGIVLLANFQVFAGAIRSDRSLRYQLVPVSLVSSLVNTVTRDSSPDRARVRLVMDPAPQLAYSYDKPTLFVVVVGETTRSQNWGLAGYARNTARAVEGHDVISFPLVTACGTSTDVSLPCMMSRIGRSDYDRKRILREEALPDVLQRAGYEVEWIDNQSGCKGVCNGVPNRATDASLDPALCPGGHCYDGILVRELERKIKSIAESGSRKPVVLFLHMIGEHGPAYTDRSPSGIKIYGPECLAPDLSSCSREEIVNAYDNGVQYTGEVLKDMIDLLAERSDINSGLVFVSDHGESLGEKGLYLHGSPYFLGISEQIDVPMFMWFSKGFADVDGAKVAALRSRSEKLADARGGRPTHENLYHTVLSLLGVKSSTYRSDYDLTVNNPPA